MHSWTDVEFLHDPHWARPEIVRCCGNNGAICIGLVNLPAFRGALAQVKRQIEDGMRVHDFGAGPYIHWFRCKRGRHRSVGMANLVGFALQECERIDCDIQHLDMNENSPRPPCGCPDACRYIANMDLVVEFAQQLLEACNEAARAWRSL